MSAMGMTTREEFEAYMAESYMDHDVYMDGLQEEIDRALALDPAALDGFDPEAYLAESYPGCTFEEAASLFGMTTGEELETYLGWSWRGTMCPCGRQERPRAMRSTGMGTPTPPCSWTPRL